MKTQKRRRREGKTNYNRRLKLLKGDLPRIIFRKTNKYIITQYVTSTSAQDKVEFGVTSKDLLEFGWPKEFEGSLKSIPASYLTGFLIGKKIAEKKVKIPTADFQMYGKLHKTRAYAFMKGLIDAGVKLKYKKEIFPDEETITGKHLKKDFSKIFNEIKSKINKV